MKNGIWVVFVPSLGRGSFRSLLLEVSQSNGSGCAQLTFAPSGYLPTGIRSCGYITAIESGATYHQERREPVPWQWSDVTFIFHCKFM